MRASPGHYVLSVCLIPLIAVLISCVETLGLSRAGAVVQGDPEPVMSTLEITCDELGASSSVNAILVSEVDPMGWTALYGAGGSWLQTDDVIVVDGDLSLYGACASGKSIRLTWWQ